MKTNISVSLEVAQISVIKDIVTRTKPQYTGFSHALSVALNDFIKKQEQQEKQ
jgi:hypothetical protein